MVISGECNYAIFLQFINKYLPNIRKLALIMDPNSAEFPVLMIATELLKACPKVETLFLERINPVNWTDNRVLFKVDDLGRLLVTIAGLASLSKLHFFARRTSEIILTTFDIYNTELPNDLAQTMIGHFLLRMVGKLRIFRMNHFRDQSYSIFNAKPLSFLYLEPLLGRIFEDILELDLEAEDCMRMTNSGTVFKNLHTLTIFGYNFDRFDAYSLGNSFQKLKELNFSHVYMVSFYFRFQLPIYL